MKLTGRQRSAIEKITGEPWDSWNPYARKAYFALTDRGIKMEIIEEARGDFDALLFAHKTHPIIVEMWKQDFRKGILFLSDFLIDECPDSYLKHVFEIYKSVARFIPEPYMKVATKLGISKW